MPAIRLFTRREIAAAFGVSPLRVTKWTAAGMPVADRGQRGKQSRYDVAAVVAWRVETEVQRRVPEAPSSGDGGGPASASINLGIERAKLARVQTRKAELEVRKREGELLEAADVGRTWSLMVLAIRSRLLALPRAMAERLVSTLRGEHAGAAAVEAELAAEVREILRELAGWKGTEDPSGTNTPPAEAVAS